MSITEKGEILTKPDLKPTVIKSAGILSSLSASCSTKPVVSTKSMVNSKTVVSTKNTVNAKHVVLTCASTHREKYICSFCGKHGHIAGFCFRLARKQKTERKIAFAKQRWQKSTFSSR